jgi:DNA-binding MarR family transcriptional regulator
MQSLGLREDGTATDLDPDVAALEALTRVLVAIAWDSAHTASDVSFPQMRLLLVLQGLGQVPSSRLATALRVNASSVTRLADRLETRGYLARGTDPENRSVVTVEVTEQGRQVVAQVLAQRQATFRTVLDRMPVSQRQTAATAAREFVRAAAADPAIALGPAPL